MKENQCNFWHNLKIRLLLLLRLKMMKRTIAKVKELNSKLIIAINDMKVRAGDVTDQLTKKSLKESRKF